MFNWFWEFLYSLVKATLYCIDFIMHIATMLCGIEPVMVDGKEQDITFYFLSSRSILDAFMLVALVGFILLFLFTIFAVIRSQAKLGEGKTPVRICIDSAKILLYFLLVPAIMIIGSLFVSTVMTAIYNATSLGSASLGSSMFTVFADEAFKGGIGESKEEILELFRMGQLDYYSTSTVSTYFSLSKINYFIAFLGGVSVLVLLAISLFSFVERIISLVLLFVVAPISMSSAALDDGARFKLWRDQVINKFLIAYGALISLNVFVLLIGVVNKIDFFPNSAFATGLARLVFIIGGAYACKRGTVLIGNLVNSGAGSQEMADRAHTNGAIGGAIKAAAMKIGSAAAAPFKLGIREAKSAANTAIHRNQNARNAIKDEAARNRYTDKIMNTNASRYSLRGRLRENLGNTGQNATVRELRGIKDILAGRNDGVGVGSGGGGGGVTESAPSVNRDNSANRASADTVRSALAGATRPGGDNPEGGAQ